MFMLYDIFSVYFSFGQNISLLVNLIKLFHLDVLIK